MFFSIHSIFDDKAGIISAAEGFYLKNFAGCEYCLLLFVRSDVVLNVSKVRGYFIFTQFRKKSK